MSEKSKKTLLIGLCAAVLLSVAAGYVKFMFLDNSMAQMDVTNAKEKKQIVELKSQLKDLLDLESRRDEIQRIRKKVEEQAKRLPAQNEIDKLILNLRRMLMMTTVSVESAKKLKPITRNIYAEIPLQINCRSAFHSFGQFFNMIEVNPDRLMRIKEFDIQANSVEDVKKKNISPFMHDIHLTLAAYVTLK